MNAEVSPSAGSQVHARAQSAINMCIIHLIYLLQLHNILEQEAHVKLHVER